jgi:hypothetical protein
MGGVPVSYLVWQGDPRCGRDMMRPTKTTMARVPKTLFTEHDGSSVAKMTDFLAELTAKYNAKTLLTTQEEDLDCIPCGNRAHDIHHCIIPHLNNQATERGAIIVDWTVPVCKSTRCKDEAERMCREGLAGWARSSSSSSSSQAGRKCAAFRDVERLGVLLVKLEKCDTCRNKRATRVCKGCTGV